MAITINQTPPATNLAQSPIVYSVIDGAYASSSFYYTCTLEIWTGSLASSGSGTQQVFVQQTRPVESPPWVWWETDGNGIIIDMVVAS